MLPECKINKQYHKIKKKNFRQFIHIFPYKKGVNQRHSFKLFLFYYLKINDKIFNKLFKKNKNNKSRFITRECFMS